MKKLLFVLLISLFVEFSVFCQSPEARLFDEYGNSINCESYLSRADAMKIEQTNNPNSRIYIIVYEGKERKWDYSKENASFKTVLPQSGQAAATIRTMEQRLRLNKAPLQNYIFVNGGFREEFGVEIWLVPPGAALPKPTPTLKKMKYRKGKPKGFCLDCC